MYALMVLCFFFLLIHTSRSACSALHGVNLNLKKYLLSPEVLHLIKLQEHNTERSAFCRFYLM